MDYFLVEDERNMGISVEHGECFVELFHISAGR